MQEFHRGPAKDAKVQLRYLRNKGNQPFALVGYIEDGEVCHVAVTGWERHQAFNRVVARNTVSGRARKRMSLSRGYGCKRGGMLPAWDIEKNGDRDTCKSATLAGIEAFDQFIANVETEIDAQMVKGKDGTLHIRHVTRFLKV